MSPSRKYPHLDKEANRQADLSDKERITAIRQGSWIAYGAAQRALDRMEDLLTYPRVTRMPNMLLVAPSFNGKTSILEHFRDSHPPQTDPLGEVTICPVLMVECPNKPDVSDLYTRILEALAVPYKTTAARDKVLQIKRLFKSMDVHILITDEIHHLITGSVNKQQEFRNAVKSLGNETKICIVAAGTEAAFNAFNTDPQMSSRFDPLVLPMWKANNEFGELLSTLEARTPLRKPSNLTEPGIMLAIHSRGEGTLGDTCDLVKELAVDAIVGEAKSECITLERVGSLEWTPPSKRREYQRF